MSENLTVERVDGVAKLTVDRPEAHNSFDRSLVDALAAATGDAVADRDVRCLVLAGTGPAFCAGADLGSFEGDATDARRLRRLATRLHVVVGTLLRARKPVVTGVNGVAAGAGVGLALAGDVVLASEAARFDFAYPRIGLSGDGGSTWLLPRLLGLGRAKEVALLDETIPAGEAVDEGLATEAVPAEEFEDRLAEVAADLAAGPTAAYGATKELLTRGLQRGLGTQLAAETERISRLASTEDFARGLAAFRGDGEPEFVGR